MLDGKLRIAPTCYHVLHLVPVMTAHEMNYFYDEGLRNAEGRAAYEILTNSMVPFGLEKLGISQAMKEKSIDIALDVQTRTAFLTALQGRGSVYHCGLEKPAYSRLGEPAAHQVAPGPQGQESWNQRLRQQTPLGHHDLVAQGRARSEPRRARGDLPSFWRIKSSEKSPSFPFVESCGKGQVSQLRVSPKRVCLFARTT
jgi:hypothetical protein